MKIDPVHDLASGNPHPRDLSRWLVQASPDGLWVFDAEGRTVLANTRLAELLGCVDEFAPMFDIVTPLGAARPQ